MKKRILHIEDDADTRQLVKMLLQRGGYSVSSGVNGLECLDILRRQKVDLVLLDVMLPDASGWEILERIRDELGNRTVKVAFLSVLSLPSEKLHQFGEKGVVDYITKPFSNDVLLSRIGRILD